MSEVPELLVNVHKQSMEAGREERMEICSSVINQCSTAPSENSDLHQPLLFGLAWEDWSCVARCYQVQTVWLVPAGGVCGGLSPEERDDAL